MEINRLVPGIGIVGGILAIAGFLLPFLGSATVGVVTTLEILALICLMIFVAAHFRTLKTFTARRSTQLGMNSILGVLLAIMIVVIVNFLAARHAPQWDLSETQFFTLTRQTYQVLRELDRDVAIKVFSHKGSPAFRAFQDLTNTYAEESSRLSVEFIDPERQPELVRTYEISRVDTAVLESGQQRIYLTKASEAELTNGLLRVTRDHQSQLVFLTGHGERSLQNQQPPGFSRAKDLLVKQGYNIETVSLAGNESLPTTTKVLIIASPQHPLSEEEQSLLSQYVETGGRLLILADPQEDEILDAFIAQWGIVAGKGIVVDEQDRLGRGSPTALLVRSFTTHDITEDFTIPILLPVSRYIEFAPKAGTDWEFVSLAQTSKESWAETTLDDTAPKFDPDKDVKGPLTIAGTITPKLSSEKPGSHPAIVIVGNAAFASNAYLNYPGNTDFFLKTVAWLAEEDQLISIPPKEPAFRPFVPNPSQEQALFLFQVLFLPGLTLMVGWSVWRRRQRL